MRFLHTADWHIGKKIHGYSLLNEQADAFEQILAIAKEQQVDAVVIAGDLYDRAIAGSDSVALLTQQLHTLNITEKFSVLAISGNHDSAIRLGSASPWYLAQHFYMQTTVAQSFVPVVIDDVAFFLLPYFEIFEVQQLFPDVEIKTLDQAFGLIVEEMAKNFVAGRRNVLVSHFFAAGSETTDSETKVQVGGLQAIAVTQLEVFDYVALGHLHNPNALHHEKIRYSGSPLAFSLSEANQKKGVVVVDVTADGVAQTFIPLKPRRAVVELTGSFADFKTNSEFLQHSDDFVGVNLTDTKVIPNVMGELKQQYPIVLQINRQSVVRLQNQTKKVNVSDPLTVFGDFFKEVTTEELTPFQEKVITTSFHELKEE